MIKLDLTKFKHEKSDEKTTTLKHKDGHMLTIANKALSPKMQEQLKALAPQEESKKEYAKGGKVKMYADPEEEVSSQDSAPTEDDTKQEEIKNIEENKAPESSNDPLKGLNININAAPQPPGANTVLAAPQADTQSTQPVGTDTVLAPQSAQETTPTQDSTQASQMPGAATPSPQGVAPQTPIQTEGPMQTFQKSKDEAKANLSEHASDYESALSRGEIHPKTYHDLFASKSTLGKIGTIFGLLVAGAGAGLTRTPNAVIEMLDKEIDNDFQAQKQSKENAINFLKVSQEQAMREAQIKGLNAETATKAFALAQVKSYQSAYHSMVEQTKKLPIGTPERTNAEQALAMMYPQVVGKINDINDQAAGAIAYNKMLFGNQANAPTDEAAFQEKMKGLKILGPQGEKRAQEMEVRHIPGVSGQASRDISEQDRKEMVDHQKLSDAAKDVLDFSSKNTNLIPGTASYNTGVAKSIVLQQAIREGLLGTVFRESEKPLLQKFVDDNPAGAFKMFSTQPKLKAIIESNDIQLNRLKKSYGFSGSNPNDPAAVRQNLKTWADDTLKTDPTNKKALKAKALLGE